MSTEQLKMILDALAQMGASGKDAFIWWVVMTNLVTPLGFALVFSILAWVANRIIKALAVAAERDSMITQIKTALELSHCGDAEATRIAIRRIKGDQT